MNVLLFLLPLIAACVGMAVWAMAERGRAGRVEVALDLLRAQGEHGAETLKAQAALSAQAVADTLVRRATETFEAQERLNQAKLEAQLKPVADTLAKFEAQAAAAEKARAEEAGGLKAQIAGLLAATAATQEEARRLSTALRRGAGVQGRWGEEMLVNVLQMAGLKRGIDYDEQVHLSGDGGGAQRPDVVVRLPGDACFVIDAKCSLTAYLEAQETADETLREACYQRHLQSVRAHANSLAAKAYWTQFDPAPDFVVMFVPGDAFLAAAVERAPDLYVQTMEKRVVLTTPSVLFALCKAVSYGWRVEKQAVNAREIAAAGAELYKRLSVMGRHVAGVGKALDGAVSHFNQFIGSLESQVLTQARRLEDFDADHQGSALPELKPVETAVRPLAKLAPPLEDSAA